ncbi:MAG: bifunctional phosphopantothenoylcysteine decarboxylase/phosphopantothenate--cysteine ligase CoaBC [Deltaproteobacteria bacterium]|nr:bifunctional phosphopantothenoylcysteine decarboxylase/phosphopantothenate--cysteine ligase CoaBC [Deltaproteobacteria bacterium]
MFLKDKEIVLGVTGGIAAYKALELTRLIVKAGGRVWPVMTAASTEFIRPLTLATLAGNPVSTGLFDGSGEDHIALAKRADLVIVAPATANMIGKVASGIADDLLSTVIMATGAPVLFAPAMHANMYENPIVRGNIEKLIKLDYRFVGPEEGDLASGEEGMGRLTDPETILDGAITSLTPQGFRGERVLVTAGPTREAIDPVRFLSSRSSGRMGYAIAQAARRRGATVNLVSGPSPHQPPEGVTVVRVTTAAEMAEATLTLYPSSSIVIMAAAVSDFRPRNVAGQKIKKGGAPSPLELEVTEDILCEMGRRKEGQFLAGFALETENIVDNAKKKLEEKGLDLIVANDTGGLDGPSNRVTLIEKNGHVEDIPLLSKEGAAGVLLDRISQMTASTTRKEP